MCATMAARPRMRTGREIRANGRAKPRRNPRARARDADTHKAVFAPLRDAPRYAIMSAFSANGSSKPPEDAKRRDKPPTVSRACEGLCPAHTYYPSRARVLYGSSKP